MRTDLLIYFLRMLLLNEKVMTWLREEAKKTDTPIDDMAVDAIVLLLSGGK